MSQPAVSAARERSPRAEERHRAILDATLRVIARGGPDAVTHRRVAAEAKFPEVERGDIVAFLDTGGYQEVSASNINAMPRPAVVLVTGDRAEAIRRRETEADAFRRDSMPKHLRHDVRGDRTAPEAEEVIAATG